MNKHCTSYEEARELLHKGELQAWDGSEWRDVAPGQLVFFSRDVEDYRRKPDIAHTVPAYFVWTRTSVPSFSVLQAHPGPKRAHLFPTARDVANFLWGLDMRETHVFKRVSLQSLDIKRIEVQLENT
jgi:hypothetical protein